MSRTTFRFRPNALARFAKIPADEMPDAGRLAAWTETFPGHDADEVAMAAALFPATAPETFARWQTIRSNITKEMEERETMIRDDEPRFTLRPLRDVEMLEFRKRVEKMHRVAEEIDIIVDAEHYKKLAPGMQKLVKRTLGWFGPADELIMSGLDEVAMEVITIKEGQFHLRAQNDQECCHSEAYSLQIEKVIPHAEQAELVRAARDDPLVARTADWVRWWVITEHPIADFIAFMALTEGDSFSGQFSTLQYFKTQNILPGVTSLNELISRDENVHTAFWCFLQSKRLRHKAEETAVQKILTETMVLSDDFFRDALADPVPGMNFALMSQYVRFVGDVVIGMMGYSPVYNTTSPFPFMDNLSLNKVAKTNFFEYTPTQYQQLSKGALTFGIDDSPIEDEDQ